MPGTRSRSVITDCINGDTTSGGEDLSFPCEQRQQGYVSHDLGDFNTLTRPHSNGANPSTSSEDPNAGQRLQQQLGTVTEGPGSSTSQSYTVIQPAATLQQAQQNLLDAHVQVVVMQSHELVANLRNLESLIQASLDFAVTDANLMSIGFEPHEVADGFQVWFYNVDSRGQGSGAVSRFGGPFKRDEAVAEFRVQMARRLG